MLPTFQRINSTVNCIGNGNLFVRRIHFNGNMIKRGNIYPNREKDSRLARLKNTVINFNLNIAIVPKRTHPYYLILCCFFFFFFFAPPIIITNRFIFKYKNRVCTPLNIFTFFSKGSDWIPFVRDCINLNSIVQIHASLCWDSCTDFFYN